MASTANNDAYGNPGWGNRAWGSQGEGAAPPGGGPQSQWNGPWGPSGPAQGWGGPSGWHPSRIGKVGWIGLTILAFIIWWPIGLAVLFYLIGSGRMGCWGRKAFAGQQNGWQGAPWNAWKGWCSGNATSQTSGNRAFDEYRVETLRRLEEEQKEFGAFLDRLRFAKDKAEFDQFMAERRQRPPAPPAEGQPSSP